MDNNLGALVAAMAKARTEFKPVHRTKKADIELKSGKHLHYDYATLDDIIAATTPALSANGLAVFQQFDGPNLVTTLAHKDGGAVMSTVPLGMPEGVEPRTAGSYITYYRRYALAAILGVSPEEDTDGDLSGKTHTDPKPSSAPSPQAPPAKPAAEWEVPFGKNKGLKLSAMTDKQLVWYRDYYATEIANPEKEKWMTRNQETLDLLNAECSRRARQNAEGASLENMMERFDAKEVPADSTHF